VLGRKKKGKKRWGTATAVSSMGEGKEKKRRSVDECRASHKERKKRPGNLR